MAPEVEIEPSAPPFNLPPPWILPFQFPWPPPNLCLYFASTLVSILASRDLFFSLNPAFAVPVTPPASLPLLPTYIELLLFTVPPISFFEESFLTRLRLPFYLLRGGAEDPREELDGDLLLCDGDFGGELDGLRDGELGGLRDGELDGLRDGELEELFPDEGEPFRLINS